MNYFNHKQIAWKTWSPQNIVFKSNNLIKKVVPSENVLSWSSKADRDIKMCERTKGKLITSKNWQGQIATYHGAENYKGVMVQMKDAKSDFPSFNIDFIDQTERLDSVGNHKGRLDILVYLNSFHSPWQWDRCPNTGNWIKVHKGSVAPIHEGYRMCYGGQGDANSLEFDEFHEMIQITEALRDFLVEMVIPAQNGNVPLELVA
jgi:hypothetical protein